MNMGKIRRKINRYSSSLDPRYPDYKGPMEPEDEDGDGIEVFSMLESLGDY